MSQEDIEKILDQNRLDASQLKTKINKIMNKLFPWPWWNSEKKKFATQKQLEIEELIENEKLPSEIMARLITIELEIREVLGK